MMQYNLKNAFPKETDEFHKKVVDTLESLPEEKERIVKMEGRKKKNWTVRKAAVVTLVAVMALGTTVFAAGKVSSITSGGSIVPVYTEFPTADQVEKDYGFAPKMVENFSNGFTFKEVCEANSTAKDEEGNEVGTAIDLTFNYEKEGKTISLDASDKPLSDMSEQTFDSTTQHNGIDLFYKCEAYKFVPEDYEMTEQDKADEASGKYIFSYGTDEVETNTIQTVFWLDNGHEYILMDDQSLLNADELMSMAQEVVDAQ